MATFAPLTFACFCKNEELYEAIHHFSGAPEFSRYQDYAAKTAYLQMNIDKTVQAWANEGSIFKP